MRTVAFLILPEFSNLGLAAAIEPLFVANWLSNRPAFAWKVVSLDGLPVAASNGLAMPVDGPPACADDCQSVFVLASFEPQRCVRERAALRWLKRRASLGVELGGIENGSWLLAEAGLLDGHRAAVHWDNQLGFQERYPEILAVSNLYVRSGARITCAGAASILDLMVAFIGWHGDPDLATEVAEHLLLRHARSGDMPQRSAPSAPGGGSDTLIGATRALMAQHVEEPLTCAELAQRMGLSLRQLERRFREKSGASLLQHYRRIRIDKAHQLLQQTALSVTEIAFACGFASPEYFCRMYRTLVGCSPSHDRRQSTSAPVLRNAYARLHR